jgi:hypothetical protein
MKNCYNENLFLEIFSEINNRFGNKPRSLLIGHNPVRKRDGINNNNYWGLFFTYSQYYKDNENPNYFALGTKESIEKLKPTLEKMLDDTELSNKVKKFNSLEKEFNEVYKTDIFDKIVKIYSKVNTDKLKLKGKCPLCPPHSWIDGF